MPDHFTLDPGKTIQLPQASPDRPITVSVINGEAHYKGASDPWNDGTPLSEGDPVTLTSQHWLTALGAPARVVVFHAAADTTEERPQRSLTAEEQAALG